MSDLELAFERLAMNFRNGTSDQDEWDDAMSGFEQALIREHERQGKRQIASSFERDLFRKTPSPAFEMVKTIPTTSKAS